MWQEATERVPEQPGFIVTVEGLLRDEECEALIRGPGLGIASQLFASAAGRCAACAARRGAARCGKGQ